MESVEAGLAGVVPEENRRLAGRLVGFARLLQVQGAEPGRGRAQLEAARTLEALDRPVSEIIARGGIEALAELPGISRSVARAVVEMSTTGRWLQYDRLRGTMAPAQLFQSVPGVGPVLAARLAEEEDLETLEDLEAFLSDPEAPVAGIGPRRRDAVLSAVRERLVRLAPWPAGAEPEPAVDLLIEVDRLYRARSAAGELPRIAPARLNPKRTAWLPVLHVALGPWQMTAMFANTGLAHRLKRTRDWVVIYFHDDNGTELRRTVVTETRGPLAGRRVVRGREADSADYHDRIPAAALPADIAGDI